LPDVDVRGPGAGRLPPRVRLQTRFLLYFTSLVVGVMAFTVLLVEERLALAGLGLAAIALGTLGSFVLARRITITRKIVEEHGGQIRLDRQVGGGTTFTVSLPVGSSS
jgi:hypothetical protein